MDANPQEKQNPDQDSFSATKISHEFFQFLSIRDTTSDEFDEEEEQEEEFSFMSGGADTSPIAAEDAFMNGKIMPVFPLFNRDLLFSSVQDLPIYKPNVDREFVEMPERGNDQVTLARVFVEMPERGSDIQVTSSTPENDDISGPCCGWSNGKAVEVVGEACKKSNSTGFSKIWRFKEFMGRSNSGGRNAFVFLNNGHAPPSSPDQPAAAVREVKRGNKGKTMSAMSAHEAYLKSKAKERRRPSYLPYRPALMGFFTNVNGGLDKFSSHLKGLTF